MMRQLAPRKLSLLLACLPIAALASPGQEAPPAPPADAGSPVLVWDVPPGARSGLPRSFRTSDSALKAKGGGLPPNLFGLSRLHAAGCGEFSADNLKAMLDALHGRVTIFDLRQEDHGFIDGEAVSWFATRNWANAGKSAPASAASEREHLKAITLGGVVTLMSDAATKNGSAPPERLTVRTVQSERELVEGLGAAYVRIAVTDHCRPSDEAVDQFILAIRPMAEGTWPVFHCRAGQGRTTTFLVLYDMLRNARAVSLADIVDRQALLIGDYNVLSNDPGGDLEPWKVELYADRAAFVRAFYDYARANPDGLPMLWSEWLKSRSAAPKR